MTEISTKGNLALACGHKSREALEGNHRRPREWGVSLINYKRGPIISEYSRRLLESVKKKKGTMGVRYGARGVQNKIGSSAKWRREKYLDKRACRAISKADDARRLSRVCMSISEEAERAEQNSRRNLFNVIKAT